MTDHGTSVCMEKLILDELAIHQLIHSWSILVEDEKRLSTRLPNHLIPPYFIGCTNFGGKVLQY